MIYTKTGDKGTTSLVGGQRVDKNDVRVEAYGTVDELNAQVGLLAEMLKKANGDPARTENAGKLETLHLQLKKIQNHLFVIQTLLATERADIYEKLPHLDDSAISNLEQWIDGMDAQLPKLNSFVIPGGSEASAQAHVARTVCRRAERRTVTLAQHEKIEGQLLQYINRLSDYLFVASRYILFIEQKEENFWSAE